MIAKLLIVGPAAAFASFLLASFENSVFEYTILEFFMLGKIPFTDVYIDFEPILVFGSGMLWAYSTIKLVGLVNKITIKYITGPKNLELISI